MSAWMHDGHVARLPAEDPAHRILSCRDPRGWTMPRASTRFMVASGGVLSEGYGHGGPGFCLGDGQTEAEGVSSRGGRGYELHSVCPQLSFFSYTMCRQVYLAYKPSCCTRLQPLSCTDFVLTRRKKWSPKTT